MVELAAAFTRVRRVRVGMALFDPWGALDKNAQDKEETASDEKVISGY
ncbi:hypothetical protein P5706_11335 [Pseudomonas sp. ChxA]|nr:hypothetical protein [Pseudomonas sp. ChxA]MDL2184776.1 hypothetical protein [Pseudomonas sp. ChxA]